MNTKLNKVYLWAIGFGGPAYLIHLISLGTPPVRIEIIAGNLLLWNCILFFLTFCAMTSHFLYESTLLKTVLTLPRSETFIYHLFSKDKFLKGLLIIVFSAVPPFALGVPKESPLLAFMTFGLSTALFYLLAQLATLLTLKKPQLIIKIRGFSLLAAGILFLISIFVINSSSGLVVTENVYYLAKCFVTLSTDKFIYLYLPLFVGLYYAGNILEEMLKSTAEKQITRELLISTAFPKNRESNNGFLKSLFESTVKSITEKKLSSNSTVLQRSTKENNRREVSLIDHFPNHPLIKRYLFLFQEAFGYNNVKNLLIGSSITFGLVFPVVFILTSQTTAAWILTPIACLFVFLITGYILNPSTLRLRKFGIAVNCREYSLANAFTIGVFLTATGLLAILLTLIFVQGDKYQFTAGSLFSNFFQFIFIVVSLILIISIFSLFYSNNSPGFTKRQFKEAGINALMFMMIYCFLGLYKLSFVAERIIFRLEKNHLVENNIIARMLSLILTPVCYLLYEKEYSYIIGIEKMHFLEKFYKISLTIPTGYLILPGWFAILSMLGISFYYVYKYGKNVIPLKYEKQRIKVHIKLFNS